MILPHAHDPAAPAVNNGISVAETALCGQPFRRATRPLTVELLVFVIRKIHHAIGHGEGAAPVLVHARAGTKWGRGDVGDRPAGRPAYHHVASPFSRPLLDPIDLRYVGTDQAKRPRGPHHRVGGDRGFPRTVRGGLRHLKTPSPASRTHA